MSTVKRVAVFDAESVEPVTIIRLTPGQVDGLKLLRPPLSIVATAPPLIVLADMPPRDAERYDMLVNLTEIRRGDGASSVIVMVNDAGCRFLTTTDTRLPPDMQAEDLDRRRTVFEQAIAGAIEGALS